MPVEIFIVLIMLFIVAFYRGYRTANDFYVYTCLFILVIAIGYIAIGSAGFRINSRITECQKLFPQYTSDQCRFIVTKGI